MKTILKQRRELANLSVLELAEKSAFGAMQGCAEYMELITTVFTE